MISRVDIAFASRGGERGRIQRAINAERERVFKDSLAVLRRTDGNPVQGVEQLDGVLARIKPIVPAKHPIRAYILATKGVCQGDLAHTLKGAENRDVRQAGLRDAKVTVQSAIGMFEATAKKGLNLFEALSWASAHEWLASHSTKPQTQANQYRLARYILTPFGDEPLALKEKAAAGYCLGEVYRENNCPNKARRCFLEVNDDLIAIQSIDKAHQVPPGEVHMGFAKTHNALGSLAYENKGDSDTAIAHYDEALGHLSEFKKLDKPSRGEVRRREYFHAKADALEGKLTILNITVGDDYDTTRRQLEVVQHKLEPKRRDDGAEPAWS